MKNLDLRVADKYQLLRRIGDGSFGAVYVGINVDTGVEVAIKLEHVSIDPSFLRQEVSIYRSLSGCTGIPRVYLHYTECEYNALVFDLLGPNLEDLFNYCGRIFSLKTVLMLADQLLCRLQVLHDHDIIHRDIKPENCLMGVGKLGNVVYVTDLGLAVDYVDISYRDAKSERPEHPRLFGTVQYASINGHFSCYQRYGDDLESLGYMFVYFLRGRLPWEGLEVGVDKEERNALILEKKETISIEDLCSDIPPEFAIYFNYVRSLRFNNKPDHFFLRKLFCILFIREGFEYDDVYDWTILKFIQSIQKENNPGEDTSEPRSTNPQESQKYS